MGPEVFLEDDVCLDGFLADSEVLDEIVWEEESLVLTDWGEPYVEPCCFEWRLLRKTSHDTCSESG